MERTSPPPNTFEIARSNTEQPRSRGNDSEDKPNRSRTSSETHNVGFKNFAPKAMTCPNCHKHITTELTYEVGDDSWSWCCCCIIMGCVLGCCLLPFYVDRFKDVVHNCPKCHFRIAHYKRHDPTDHRRV